jgi:hypothetical protein
VRAISSPVLLCAGSQEGLYCFVLLRRAWAECIVDLPIAKVLTLADGRI